jgi:hypothetical protein
MKFIVDRKTWYRGKGIKDSRLLREDGKMCCIGFVGKQCGVPDTDLLGIGNVTVGLQGHGLFPAWVRNTLTSISIRNAYSTNDSEDLTDSEREAQLKEIFLREGDEIEFQD